MQEQETKLHCDFPTCTVDTLSELDRCKVCKQVSCTEHRCFIL